MNEPNMVEKVKNLTDAMINWATHDKFARVSPEIFSQRKKICVICQHWDNEKYGGLGACKLCGCSIGKLYIPSSICPDDPPKWLSVSASYTTGSVP